MSDKVNKLFVRKNNFEIFNLGGTKNPTFDPKNEGTKLYDKGYFYEKVPLKTENGEIHIYGNELKEYVHEWMEGTRKGDIQDNFQSWMGTKIPALKGHEVRYFSEAERSQTEIVVKEGVLTQIGLDSKADERSPLKEGA